MLSNTEIKTRLEELLDAYNAGNAKPFEDFVSDDLPFKEKVLDEIKSSRFGQVEVLDVVVEGLRAAEYWVERGMVRNGKTIPEIWGVNVYTFDHQGLIVDFVQVEEPRQASAKIEVG